MFDRADAKNRHRSSCDVVNGRRHGKIWVTSQILLRQDDVQQRLRLAAGKSISPIIKTVAELNRAANGFEFMRLGVESEIVAGDGNARRFIVVAAMDGSAVIGSRAINLVVRAEPKIVHNGLLVA